MNSLFTQWHQLAGVIGTLFYVISYLFVQMDWIKAPGYLYCGLNLVAAILVGVSLVFEFNLASALIQISWVAISVIGVLKLLFFSNHRTGRRRRRRRRSGMVSSYSMR